MTIWEKLGIEATKDLALIRSAYAAKAKEMHPEEHPEEFQELQKAYKTAVKYAKSGTSAVKFTEIMRETVLLEEEPVRQEVQKKAEEVPEEEVPEEEMLEENEKEQMFDYDYGEIQEETTSYQFFQEFFYIVWNPWLLNNQICWDLFLHKPQYKVLFEDKDFRKNVVMTMSRLSGWHRDTIRYFDSFLKTFQSGEETKAETEYFWWRWKRGRPWNRGIVTTEKWITKDQKDMQSILLSAVRTKIGLLPEGKKRGEIFFKDKRAVETYLQVYFAYAPRNPWKLEKMYHANCSGKSFARAMFLVLLFWFCLLLFINLKGDFPKKQTEQEKLQEKWEQEREDNIRKYLEEYKETDNPQEIERR